MLQKFEIWKKITNTIEDFQELDAQRKALEPIYQRILDSLPESDRENLIEYEYLISELAYQKMQAAYQLGCRRMV